MQMKKNTRCFSSLPLCIFFFFFFHSTAKAELTDPCGCDAGLARTFLRSSATNRASLAYLSQIDEKQYNGIKRGGGGGIGIGKFFFRGSYEQFDQSRREYLSKMNYNTNVEQSRILVYENTKTSSWLKCKQDCIAQQRGFFCGLAKLTQNHTAVTCSWRPEGEAKKRKVTVTLNGQEKPSKEIEPNTTRDWQFERNRNATLLLTFTLESGSSTTLEIPATPQETTHPRPLPQKTCNSTPKCEGNTLVLCQKDGVTEKRIACTECDGGKCWVAWDATREFSSTSNPSGVWSSGYSLTLGGHFYLYTILLNYVGRPYWTSAIGICPNFSKNTLVSPLHHVQSGWLSLHPGPSNQYSVLRWTAPKSSNECKIEAQFLAGDAGETSATILKNDSVLWAAPSTTPDPKYLSKIMPMRYQDHVDFVVGTRNYRAGSTPIKVIISCSVE